MSGRDKKVWSPVLLPALVLGASAVWSVTSLASCIFIDFPKAKLGPSPGTGPPARWQGQGNAGGPAWSADARMRLEREVPNSMYGAIGTPEPFDAPPASFVVHDPDDVASGEARYLVAGTELDGVPFAYLLSHEPHPDTGQGYTLFDERYLFGLLKPTESGSPPKWSIPDGEVLTVDEIPVGGLELGGVASFLADSRYPTVLSAEQLRKEPWRERAAATPSTGSTPYATDRDFAGTYYGRFDYDVRPIIAAGILKTGPFTVEARDVVLTLEHLDADEVGLAGVVMGLGKLRWEDEEYRFAVSAQVTSNDQARGLVAVGTTVGDVVAGQSYRMMVPIRTRFLLSDRADELTMFLLGVPVVLRKTGEPPAPYEKDEVRARPNLRPDVTIVAPPPGSTFARGELVALEARVTDLAPDGTVDSVVADMPYLVWRSDRDGVFGVGGPVPGQPDRWRATWADLSPGIHEIAFTAWDPRGLRASDTIRIEVLGSPPEPPVIRHPLPGTDLYVGVPYTFQGVGGFDPDDGFAEYAVVSPGECETLLGGTLAGGQDWPKLDWSFSAPGNVVCPEGREVRFVPSQPGTVTVTFRVTDSQGQTAEATQQHTVLPNDGQSAPFVVIESPEPVPSMNHAILRAGAQVTFAGRATDLEDPPASLALLWTFEDVSDPANPVLVHQASTKNLTWEPRPEHAFKKLLATFTATDPGGLSGTAQLPITILPEDWTVE